MRVERADLEASLAGLKGEMANPIAGLFGPSSKTWSICGRTLVFAGGGAAMLLQAAHPFVAQAIIDHSVALEDVQLRFQRTFLQVFDMVFGDGDQALVAARRVHGIHTRIEGTLDESLGAFERGQAYHANDPEALRWVASTLLYSAVRAYEAFVRPLPDRDKDQLHAEWARMEALFGIPADGRASSYRAFCDYVDETIEGTLGVGRAARRICDTLMVAPRPVSKPLFALIRAVTAGLLPARIREGYGLPYGAAEQRLFRASAATSRALMPVLPTRLRQMPAQLDGRRRLRGQEGADPVGELVWRTLLALLERR